MASASASRTVSKAFNVTKPAVLQSLIRRHLIRPSTAVSNLLHIDYEEMSDSFNKSVNARNSDLYASKSLMNLTVPFNSALPRIEMKRTYVTNDAEEEFIDDEDEDEDDEEDDDDDDDEDIEDFDDEDDVDARPRTRRYKE